MLWYSNILSSSVNHIPKKYIYIYIDTHTHTHGVSYTDHIRVVPPSRPGCRYQDILVPKEPVNNVQDAVPRVLDVAIVAPQVADLAQQSVVNLKTKK